MTRRPIAWAGLAFGAMLTLACGRVVAAEPKASGPTLPAEVVVLATKHGASVRESDVRVVALVASGTNAKANPRTLATVTHAPSGAVRGDVATSAGWQVALVVDTDSRSDFGSALWHVREQGAETVMATGLYRASRPLFVDDHTVLVETGAEGPAPSAEAFRAGQLREDRLAITSVHLGTRARREIYRRKGYTLHLIGRVHREALVYAVDTHGAELVAIDMGSGKVRSLGLLPPVARDFSIDLATKRVVFTLPGDNPKTITIATVDVVSGSQSRISAASDAAPFVTPSGALFAKGAHASWVRATGEFVAPVASNARADWLAVRVVRAGVEETFGEQVQTGASVRLCAPNERCEVIGFRGGGALR